MKIQRCTWSSTLVAACLLSSFALLSGCVNTTLQQVREADTGISADQTVVILGRKHIAREQTENFFVDCVTDKTSSGSKKVSVMSEQEFIDELFPWFEPRTAPSDIAALRNISNNEKIVEKMDEMGVRYIVWIEGTTQRTDQAGTVQCAVATGGIPACFGFLTWEASSNYEATIWDIESNVSAGKVSAESKGMSFVPAIIVPLPFIARTPSHACGEMSKQLKDFIAGE